MANHAKLRVRARQAIRVAESLREEAKLEAEHRAGIRRIMADERQAKRDARKPAQ